MTRDDHPQDGADGQTLVIAHKVQRSVAARLCRVSFEGLIIQTGFALRSAPLA